MGFLSGRPLTAEARAPGATRSGAYWGISNAADMIPVRTITGTPPSPVVTGDTALRHSAVWACLRTRADLISTFPLDVFRRVADVQVQCPTPPVLTNPAGRAMGTGDTGILEWLYSSQIDLDRTGNAIGLIQTRDGFGLPSKIELAPAAECACLVRGGQIWKYRIAGTLYDPSQVWHERAYTVAGMYVGLSPVAYAAWAIGEYLSVQQFAMNWFSSGAVPRSRLKNTAKKISPTEAAIVKESWRASITVGEPFVTGSDWDYEMIQAEQASADWLEAKKFSVTDIARFFGVPSDIIDSAPTGGTRTMTYANISQRNLQLLTYNLGPSLIRREAALSGMTPQPRYVKFNTDALLRMDPLTRAQTIATQIKDFTLTVDEARELDNRAPLTDEQIARMLTMFPPVGAAVPLGAAADEAPVVATIVPPDDGGGDIDPAGSTPAIES